MGFDLFKTISDGWNSAANAVTSTVNDGWNAVTSTVNDGWNAITGAAGAAASTVNDGWNAVTSTVNDGWNAVTKTAGDIYNAGAGFVENASNVAGSIGNTLTKGYNLLTKYWYVPVIIGGVIVGYILVKKNPAANAAQLVKLIAAAK